MKILALEPYYGGSHKAFLDGWRAHSRHNWTVCGLPPNWWKWRMRHSSITLASEVAKRLAADEQWDVVFCSDMLNLAEFRGLVSSPVRDLPSVIYFHENQWTYPTQNDDPRDQHYGFNNFVSALAADEVWFNSRFHCNEFLGATRRFLDKMPDHTSQAEVDLIERKSVVEPPGIDSVAQTSRKSASNGVLHITWAARWEFDKNPDMFFAALRLLKTMDVKFRLSVLGQSFRNRPAIFELAQEEFKDEIVNWGFADSRTQYLNVLKETDVFVSTADHEFFGISAVEAISCGAYPLLPHRLAYPEVLDIEADPVRQRHLYDGNASVLAKRLRDLSRQSSLKDAGTEQLTLGMSRYFWQTRAKTMDDRLEGISILSKPV